MKEKNVQTIINSSNFQQILLNIKNLFKYNFETHQFQNVSLTTRLNILFFQSWLEIFPWYFARQISPLSSNNQNPTIICADMDHAPQGELTDVYFVNIFIWSLIYCWPASQDY